MTLCDPCAHDADAAVAGRSGVMAVYLADDDALCLFVEGGGVALTATEARQLVAAIGNALTVRAARGVAL